MVLAGVGIQLADTRAVVSGSLSRINHRCFIAIIDSAFEGLALRVSLEEVFIVRCCS